MVRVVSLDLHEDLPVRSFTKVSDTVLATSSIRPHSARGPAASWWHKSAEAKHSFYSPSPAYLSTVMTGRSLMLPSPGSFMRLRISQIAQPFSSSMEYHEVEERYLAAGRVSSSRAPRCR
jgi:hypothetical protein